MTPLPEMGPIIREAKERRGWSDQNLARRVGVSGRYIRYLLDGERCPSREIARMLEHELGITITLPPAPPRRSQRRAAARAAKATPPEPPPPPPSPPRVVNGYRPRWW